MEDESFHLFLDAVYLGSLFFLYDLFLEKEFDFFYVFFDEFDVIEIFKVSAFEHFFHHCHMGVSTELSFGNMSGVLMFGEEIDNFIDVFYEFLFCGIEFFEYFAVYGHA